ncbi:MAG: hypothetical protein MSH15_01845 [Oscillospiraceae bacterium]|nr:hypothetical protein [Oscillospiraceae bacterium]
MRAKLTTTEMIKKYRALSNPFQPYKDEPNPDRWNDFDKLMRELGFEIDCYNSYKDIYPDSERSGKDKQDEILDNLSKCSLQIAGNYIFSRYRELTHWSDYGYPEEKGEYFFKKAFAILENKFEQDNL